MPRTKDFEPTRALNQAMVAFWRHGYARTSLDRLVGRTQASRYGLYSTFGSKKNLLAHALRHYRQDIVEPLVTPLESPAASLREISEFFHRVAALHDAANRSGCLMCNTAIELGQSGSAPALLVRDHFAQLRKLLGRALRNAATAGELRAGLKIEACTHYLVGVAAGSFLLARADMPGDMIRAFLRTSVRALKSLAVATS